MRAVFDEGRGRDPAARHAGPPRPVGGPGRPFRRLPPLRGPGHLAPVAGSRGPPARERGRLPEELGRGLGGAPVAAGPGASLRRQHVLPPHEEPALRRQRAPPGPAGPSGAGPGRVGGPGLQPSPSALVSPGGARGVCARPGLRQLAGGRLPGRVRLRLRHLPVGPRGSPPQSVRGVAAAGSLLSPPDPGPGRPRERRGPGRDHGRSGPHQRLLRHAHGGGGRPRGALRGAGAAAARPRGRGTRRGPGRRGSGARGPARGRRKTRLLAARFRGGALERGPFELPRSRALPAAAPCPCAPRVDLRSGAALPGLGHPRLGGPWSAARPQGQTGVAPARAGHRGRFVVVWSSLALLGMEPSRPLHGHPGDSGGSPAAHAVPVRGAGAPGAVPVGRVGLDRAVGGVGHAEAGRGPLRA